MNRYDLIKHYLYMLQHKKFMYSGEMISKIWKISVKQCMLFNSLLFLGQAYISFEQSEGNFERTRSLYERLLKENEELKKNATVWISYARFEASLVEDAVVKSDSQGDSAQRSQCLERASGVLQRAKKYLGTLGPKFQKEKELVGTELSKVEQKLKNRGNVKVVGKN